MRSTFVASLFALLLPTAAWSASFDLPEAKPLATITIPDDWKPSRYDNGVEATSPDEGVYLAAEVVSGKNIAEATEESFKLFIKEGVKIDEKTKKETEFKLNGMPGYELSFDGKDSDGDPTNVSVAFLVLSETKFVFLTYWGSPEGDKANAAALQAIAKSIVKK